MKTILILTDQPVRGRKLAAQLVPLGDAFVLDLLDPYQARNQPDLSHVAVVIGDTSLAHSQQVAGLHKYIHQLGRGRVPFLCLLHEDTPRARVQAQALGAGGTLRADAAADALIAALGALGIRPRTAPPPKAGVADTIADADAALTRIFDLGRAGGPLAPSMVAAGADLVVGALDRADIRTWLDVVWQFDDATHQHCMLVAGLAAAFARQLGLRQQDCSELTQAALLHDVGKSRIPLAILNKPGRLDDAEMAVIRTHPAAGYDMLRDQGYPDILLAVVRSHHEALDGSGYPDNLPAHRIPDMVRLITVCDIFGALIERRAYKRPFSGAVAYDILQDMVGKVDPDLVKAFRPIAEATGSAVRPAA